MIPRVIPALLLDGDRFVKTVRFEERTYVGDPVNVLNIFNALEVDEILLLDINATPQGSRPQFELLSRLASECFIPLTYGGGLGSVDDIGMVLSIGFEKVVLNSIVPRVPEVVSQAADRFGSQAVAVGIDARRTAIGYEVFTEGARSATGREVGEYAAWVESLGAGEIMVTSVERDGTMTGFDLDLVGIVASAVRVPVIASGGADSRAALAHPVRAGAAAVAAGSLFLFSGKGGGVLVNFPSRPQLARIFDA